MRRGTTLVELVVTLVLIALLAGLAAASVGTLAGRKESVRAQALERARRRAIHSGHPVRMPVADSAQALFLPDGRAIGDGVDYLTGEVRHADR